MTPIAWIAIAGFTLTILTTVATSAMVYGAMREKIKGLDGAVGDLKDGQQRHADQISGLRTDVSIVMGRMRIHGD